MHNPSKGGVSKLQLSRDERWIVRQFWLGRVEQLLALTFHWNLELSCEDYIPLIPLGELLIIRYLYAVTYVCITVLHMNEF